MNSIFLNYASMFLTFVINMQILSLLGNTLEPSLPISVSTYTIMLSVSAYVSILEAPLYAHILSEEKVTKQKLELRQELAFLIIIFIAIILALFIVEQTIYAYMLLFSCSRLFVQAIKNLSFVVEESFKVNSYLVVVRTVYILYLLILSLGSRQISILEILILPLIEFLILVATLQFQRFSFKYSLQGLVNSLKKNSSYVLSGFCGITGTYIDKIAIIVLGDVHNLKEYLTLSIAFDYFSRSLKPIGPFVIQYFFRENEKRSTNNEKLKYALTLFIFLTAFLAALILLLKDTILDYLSITVDPETTFVYYILLSSMSLNFLMVPIFSIQFSAGSLKYHVISTMCGIMVFCFFLILCVLKVVPISISYIAIFFLIQNITSASINLTLNRKLFVG